MERTLQRGTDTAGYSTYSRLFLIQRFVYSESFQVPGATRQLSVEAIGFCKERGYQADINRP